MLPYEILLFFQSKHNKQEINVIFETIEAKSYYLIEFENGNYFIAKTADFPSIPSSYFH